MHAWHNSCCTTIIKNASYVCVCVSYCKEAKHSLFYSTNMTCPVQFVSTAFTEILVATRL